MRKSEIRIIPKLCPPVPPACESGGGCHVPPGPMVAPPMPASKLQLDENTRSRLMDWMVDVTVTHMSKPTCVRQRPDRVVALRLVSVSKGRLQLFSAAHNLSLSCCVARMRCKSARYWLTAAPIATPHRQQMGVASAICFVSDVCRR